MNIDYNDAKNRIVFTKQETNVAAPSITTASPTQTQVQAGFVRAEESEEREEGDMKERKERQTFVLSSPFFMCGRR